MRKQRWQWVTMTAALALAGYQELLFAQASPWARAVRNVQTVFEGPIATGLATIAIVVGGVLFMFNEGGAKQTLAGIIFGVGMAVGAARFLNWIF